MTQKRKKVQMWSAGRPKRPKVDPLYTQIRTLLKYDKRSTWALADASGLSTTTLRNWSTGKVRHPQGTSLQMAARALGKRIALVDVEGDK